jgi:hypothetical protein
MTTSGSTSAERSLGHDALVTPKSVRLSMTAPRCPPSDYHTDPILRHMTKTTRRIGRNIPVSWQHGFRDSGGFRWLSDSLVTSLAIPLGAVTCPSAARDFVKLSRDFKQLRYGDHESQFIDVFLPDENHNYDPASDATTTPKTTPKARVRVRGMVFFVHGGAWGSGKPWFYRLVTKPFLEMGLAVAIVGYRVYPLCGSPRKNDADRGGVRTQVDDLEAAFGKLTQEYPEWCDKNFEDRFVERRFVERKTTNSKPIASTPIIFPTWERSSWGIPPVATFRCCGWSNGSRKRFRRFDEANQIILPTKGEVSTPSSGFPASTTSGTTSTTREDAVSRKSLPSNRPTDTTEIISQSTPPPGRSSTN